MIACGASTAADAGRRSTCMACDRSSGIAASGPYSQGAYRPTGRAMGGASVIAYVRIGQRGNHRRTSSAAIGCTFAFPGFRRRMSYIRMRPPGRVTRNSSFAIRADTSSSGTLLKSVNASARSKLSSASGIASALPPCTRISGECAWQYATASGSRSIPAWSRGSPPHCTISLRL